MKKFSVLTLIILLLFVPLIVYGVYGLVNNNSPALTTPNEPKPIAKTLDEPSPPDPNAPPKLPNPFFQIMPHGIKGNVVNINPISKVIRLTDAYYINPDNSINKNNKYSDFTIYLDSKTAFIKDLSHEGKFSDISENSEIICVGPFNFDKKEIKFAKTIFTGSLIHENFQAELPAEGSIEELDRGNNTFTIDLSSMYDEIGKLNVHITETTACYVETISGKESSVEEIGNGIIPDFALNGTFVRSKIRLRYGESNAYADFVSFVNP